MKKYGFRNFWLRFVFGMMAAVFLILFAYSLIAGYRLSDEERSDYPYFFSKNIPLTILLLLCAVTLLMLSSKLKISVKAAVMATLLFIFAAGCAWVLCIRMSARWDQCYCLYMADLLLTGEFETLMKDSYLCGYPFQLGFVLYCALVKLCFGENAQLALCIVNVAWLTGMDAVILYETSQALRNAPCRQPVMLCLCVMLICGLQPIMLCNLIYGNLPGISLSVCAMGLAIRFCRKPGVGCAAAGVMLLSLGCLMKSNCQIVCIALICCMFLVSLSVSEKRLRFFGFSFALVLPLFAQSVLVFCFEKAVGVSFGTSVPILSWLVMGLQNGYRMQGWHNGYTNISNFAGLNAAQRNAKVTDDLRQTVMELFSSPADCLRFFKCKLTSSWLETSFCSLQINRGANQNFANLPESITWLFYGKRADILEQWMDTCTQVLYLGFGIGCIRSISLRKKEGFSWLAPLLPVLTVFGAFLYHALFETKSLYMFIYLPLMAPVAAYGICTLSEKMKTFLPNRCRRRQRSHPSENSPE